MGAVYVSTNFSYGEVTLLDRITNFDNSFNVTAKLDGLLEFNRKSLFSLLQY